jgi:hypothetical protein
MSVPQLLRTKDKTSIIECPHCQSLIELKTQMHLELTGVALSAGDDAPQEEWRKTLTPEQRQMLDGLKANGTIEAFTAVLKETRLPEQMPKNAERFFLNWLRKAGAKAIPQHAMDYLTVKFNQARIEFWAAEGVGCVIADRAMKRFVPYNLVNGTAVVGLNGNKNRRTETGIEELNTWWVRTRYGFVAGKGALFQTLKVKSIGEFARPVL